jgi:hypothetical protein
MLTEWIAAALPYIGGGVLGSAVTYGLSWAREHRRTLDAYRAPQRHAIGEILAAAHEFQLRLLNWRRAMTDLIEEIRQDRTDNLPAISAEIRQSEAAYAVAMLDVRRAFEVGSLTVVDVKCWEAMVAAAAVFARFNDVINDGPVTRSADEAEQLNDGIGRYAEQLRAAMTALVRAAHDRVTPAETYRNRRRRRDAQHRLADETRTATGEIPESP